MKDKTAIKYFDKRFKKLKNYWWKPACTRCGRHVPIDTIQDTTKEILKKIGYPKGFRIMLCKECRKNLKIRRFFDKK